MVRTHSSSHPRQQTSRQHGDSKPETSSLGSGIALLTKGAFPDGNHYNSTRLPVSDRLDSSPLEFEFSVSQSFVAAVRRLASGAGGSKRGAPSSRRSRGVACPVAALRQLVSCEIVYYDGSAPMIFVENDDASPESYRLSHIPPCRLVELRLEDTPRRLVLSVDRKFPLSSSHGGRRFRLAFTLHDHVMTTDAFTVFAKKAKVGVGCKFVHKPKELAVDPARVARLAAIRAAVSEGHAIQRRVASPLAVAAVAAAGAGAALDALSLPPPLPAAADMPVPAPAARLRSLPFDDMLSRALEGAPPAPPAAAPKRAEHPEVAASHAKRVRCSAPAPVSKPAFDGTVSPDTVVGGDSDVARAVWLDNDTDFLPSSAASPLDGFEALEEDDFLSFLDDTVPRVDCA